MELGFYYHPESGSPFATYDPPELVLDGPDGGLCHPVTEQQFYDLCAKEGVEPVIPPKPVTHCHETRNRIRLALAAWAYEVHDDSLMSDAEFDHLALQIDVRKSTARPDLDEWFRKNFNPSTGMWVLNHPEKGKLESLYRFMKAQANNSASEPLTQPTLWEVLLKHTLS